MAPQPTSARRDPLYLGPALEVALADLHKFEKKREWLIEPKLDGMFASYTVQNPAEKRPHVLKSRDARTPPVSGTNAGDLPLLNTKGIPEGSVFAGELEAATQWATKVVAQRGFRRFHVFDILRIGTRDLRDLPLAERKLLLKATIEGVEDPLFRARVVQVPFALDFFAKRYESWIAAGYEGVVVKQIFSEYKAPTSDGKTRQWMRCKKTYTHDYVLVGLAYTAAKQLTGEWGLYDNGKVKKVLQAFAPAEYLQPANVGKLVAEFSGWALFSSGALRHAQFVQVRADKTPEQCTMPIPAEE